MEVPEVPEDSSPLQSSKGVTLSPILCIALMVQTPAEWWLFKTPENT